MHGVKRSFRATGKSGVFERVCGGPEESGGRAGNSTLRESSPTLIGIDRGHPHSFKGYLNVQKEVMVTFIVVASFSLYTAILGRP